MTYSESIAETFTIAHARYLASKVATDLLRFQRFYGEPNNARIDQFEGELVVLLKHDVISNVVYGFQRQGKWTEATVRYTALPGGSLSADDDPGKIRPGLDIFGANFTSFLSYNLKWTYFSQDQQMAIRNECPIQRTTMPTPPLEFGYWHTDLNYFAGGRGIGRETVRR